MFRLDTRNVSEHVAEHYEARYSLNAILESSKSVFEKERKKEKKKTENPGNSYFVVHLKRARMLDVGRSELTI